MNSIYIPEKNDDKKNIIFANGKNIYLDAIHGESLGNGIAPFVLNPIQRAFHEFYNNKNAVIATPTGTGKTTVAFMAMYGKGNTPKKTLYLSPTRALARQVFKELSARNLKVYLRTGESKMDVKDDYDIVVLTPEAFLAARHSSSIWIEMSELIIIDEAHMLVQDTRGIVYEESIVHALSDEKELILLSATMPDSLEMANWINADLLIESNWRPISLHRDFVKIAAPSRKNSVKVAKTVLKEFLLENIENGIKTMIIIPSKKSGWFLLEAFEYLGYSAANETVPYIKPEATGDPHIAFHNADIPLDEKEIIEKSFKSGEGGINVLISTQTLAYGFNSPADDILIFVKYSPYQEDKLWPSFIDLLQFEGRAGRKGFSKRGYGRVLYSTGASGDKTQKILQSKLKQGLSDRLQTALDKSFETISRQFAPSLSKDLGNIELASLGIMSVDPTRLEKTHYKNKDKSSILSTALERLQNINMLGESGRISPLGKLTASYMLNPETVWNFIKLNDKEDDETELYDVYWELWKGIAELIPTNGLTPPYYPPFVPLKSCHVDPFSLGGNTKVAGLLNYGLGNMTMKAGLAMHGGINEVKRQHPPAWTASMYNDTRLVVSFYKQGARLGFWQECEKNALERIERSFYTGVHPNFCMLTTIPEIGSIRANILSTIYMKNGIYSDVDLVSQYMNSHIGNRNLLDKAIPFLTAWYNLQIRWLKESLGIKNEISTREILKLDARVFEESLNIIERRLMSSDFFKKPSLPPGLEEESFFDIIETEILNEFPKSHSFIFTDHEKYEQLSDEMQIVTTDISGEIIAMCYIYAPGRMPPSSVLGLIPRKVPVLATDSIEFKWLR